MREFIDISSFRTITLEGTTSGTADARTLFYHNTKALPQFWIATEGDVYIPKNGIGLNEVDVRSRLTSQPFTILLFF